MTNTETPTLVTGLAYANGVETTVTGYPVHRHLRHALRTPGARTPVDLLTPGGEIVRGVRVLEADMRGVRILALHRLSERMLWRFAEIDFYGFGNLALAELARREAMKAARVA